MTKQIIIMPFIILVSLLIIIFNIGNVRCEEESDTINAQPQAKYLYKSTGDRNEDDLQDNKSKRFKELEWIIKMNLIAQYQTPEEIGEAEIPD